MKPFLGVLLVVVLVGCASFATHVFRVEQAITGAAYSAYVGYTNGLASGTIKVSQTTSNQIRQARLDFAASIKTLESWRAAYETNSAVESQLRSALDAASLNSSNVVYLIKHL